MKIIPERSTREPPPFQFSLRTLLIGVTIFCVLLGLLVPAVRSAREAARLVQLSNHFKEISWGLQNYAAGYNQFPAANGVDSTGKPINSWRLWMVVYITQLPVEPVQAQIPYDPNLPWDDPTHSRLAAYFSEFYCDLLGTDTTNSTESQILAITGSGTAFEDGKTYKPGELPNDLIIIVETRNSGLHWMEPGDLDIRTMPRIINAPDGRGIAANIGDRFHVIFADGSVWQLSADVPFGDVEKFLTIDGAKQHDRDEVLGDYVTGR